MSQFGTLKRRSAYSVICKDVYTKAVTTTSAHQLETSGETTCSGDTKFKFDINKCLNDICVLLGYGTTWLGDW